MPITVRKFRLVNPSKTAARKRRSSTRAKRRAIKRRNPVHLVTLGFANPHKGTTVKKRKKNSAKARVRRRRNPLFSLKTAPKKVRSIRRRRRNPEMLSKGTELAKTGASALVGLVAARQIPQMVLGTKNTGIVGYLATALTVFATHMAIKKAAGASAANAAMIGGAMQFASRLLNEYVSPVGKVLSLSGVGDPVAAGLGEIRSGYFPVPVVNRPGTFEPIIPAALQPRQLAPASAPATATLSGTRRTGSRFASRY